MNSNNFLEVLIAGVNLTPRVKYVSTFEGHRRVKGGLGQGHSHMGSLHSYNSVVT